MYDEDDDEYDTDDYVAPRGLSLGKSPFAAMLGRAKESNGASIYDATAQHFRQQYGRPRTDMAEADYAQQSGALDQLAQRFGVQRTKADDSEKWLSVAAALFAPTETGKTSESLAKALGVYAGAKGAERKEERETSLALAKLMQRYESDAQRASTARYKAENPRLVMDQLAQARHPITGAIVADASGQPVAVEEAPVAEVPVLTVEQAALVDVGTVFRDVNGKIRTKH